MSYNIKRIIGLLRKQNKDKSTNVTKAPQRRAFTRRYFKRAFDFCKGT